MMEKNFYKLDILKLRLSVLKTRLSTASNLITKKRLSVLKSEALSLVTLLIVISYAFSNSSINDITIENQIYDKLIYSTTASILATGIYQSIMKTQELKDIKETYKYIQKEIEYVKSIMPIETEQDQRKALKNTVKFVK